MLVLCLSTVVIGFLLMWFFRKSPTPIYKATVPLSERDFIEYEDLMDPNIRQNPHEFNKHLQRIITNSKSPAVQKGILPVHGEKNTFLICNYALIKQILAKDQIFASNPFKDEPLIAPHAIDDERHTKIFKYVKKYYSTTVITKQIPQIQHIINKITKTFIDRQTTNQLQQMDKSSKKNDVMFGFCRRIVMQTSLFMMGLPTKIYTNNEIVNKLIKFNDEMVILVAPVGGIGYKINFSFQALFNLIFGLLFATFSTLKLIRKIGISNAWQLLRPDLNVLRLPNAKKDDGFPRLQIWIYPHLLHNVPKYFLYLNELYETYGIKAKCPNPSMQTNILNGKNVLQSMYEAEQKGDMNRAEIIVTIVQLMVNMTTANMIANVLYRISEKDIALKEYVCDENGKYDDTKALRLIEEILRYESSMQRLPRRCRVEVNDFYGQKFPENSILLNMIGYANCEGYEHGFEFIPDRHKNIDIKKPLTFGYGMHLCLGYWLVKREMNLALRSLVENKINKIEYVSAKRMKNIDVGNYGFNELVLKFK